MPQQKCSRPCPAAPHAAGTLRLHPPALEQAGVQHCAQSQDTSLPAQPISMRVPPSPPTPHLPTPQGVPEQHGPLAAAEVAEGGERALCGLSRELGHLISQVDHPAPVPGCPAGEGGIGGGTGVVVTGQISVGPDTEAL